MTFSDQPGDTLHVALDLLGPGKATLKKVGTPRTGVRVRFQPHKNRAVVKIGAFDAIGDKTVLDFSAQPTQTLHVQITLDGGSAIVVLTDDQGGQHTVGPKDSVALSAGDAYRLKLHTVHVNGVCGVPRWSL